MALDFEQDLGFSLQREADSVATGGLVKTRRTLAFPPVVERSRAQERGRNRARERERELARAREKGITRGREGGRERERGSEGEREKARRGKRALICVSIPTARVCSTIVLRDQ